MSHTVTITKLPDETSDDYEYEFGGTHGPDCAVWVECKRARCRAMDPDHFPGDERVRHGKEHVYRDGDWLVKSDICALCYVFEYIGENETFDGLALGTYPTYVNWEDSWWLEVQPARIEKEEDR